MSTRVVCLLATSIALLSGIVFGLIVVIIIHVITGHP